MKHIYQSVSCILVCVTSLGHDMYLLSLCVLLSGCQIAQTLGDIKSAITLKSSKIWLEKINIKAVEDLNDSSPVKLHVVIAYTLELMLQLNKMDSKTYFRSIEQLKADFLGKIDIFEIEVIPGQNLTAPIAPSKVDAEGGFIFAHYTSAGMHRINIGENQVMSLLLNKTSFTIQKDN